MEKINITINIPKNIKMIIWKNKNKKSQKIFLYHKNKLIKIIKNNIFVDKWGNSLTFEKRKFSENKKIEKKINFFLNSINNYYYSKIKFKGKGFRIKFFKKIKLIKFYFGKSHKTFFLLKKIKKKRLSKYKFIIFCINKKKVLETGKKISNIKKINVYTLRGIRIAKQIIYKRKGKKGTYI